MTYRNKATRLLYAILCALPLLLPAMAFADSLKGTADLTYSVSRLKVEEVDGGTSRSQSNAFQQNYSLALDKILFPNLKASGGGMFNISQSDTTIDGVSGDAEATSLSPYLDLSLNSPFVQAQTGYRRRESNSQANGVRSAEQVVESYSTRIGLTPIELPKFNLTYSKQFAYDEFRQSRDVEQDNWSWSSSYQPRDGVFLQYAGNYSSQLNNITEVEAETTSHSASAQYARSVLGGRGNFASSYSVTYQNSKASATGSSGVIITPVNAGAALTGVTSDSTPGNTAAEGTLTVDNTLIAGTAQIDIVLPLGAPPSAQVSERNFGLEFLQPVQLNSMFLRVGSGTAQPDAIGALAGRFSWAVYTSSDGGNTWRTIPATVTFERDPANPGAEDFGFVLRFATVTTRHVKGVVTLQQLDGVLPPPGVNLSSIYVSRVTGLLTEQAQSRESSNTGGSLNTSFSTVLLDFPSTSYNASLSMTHGTSGSGGGTTYLYSVTNGIVSVHRFNDVFEGQARISGEFSGGTNVDSAFAGIFSAGLQATPLPTLGHSLIFSGRFQNSQGETETTESVSLTNTVELYQGISANLSGSYSKSDLAQGNSGETLVLNFGLSLVPHPKLSIATGYSEAITSQRDASGERKINSDAYDISFSYKPFPQLFLSGSYGVSSESNSRSITTASYGAGWSPLPGGSLQANVVYSEGYTTVNGTKTKTLSPGLRWNIRPGSSFTLTYLLALTSSNDVDSELSTTTANLNVTF